MDRSLDGRLAPFDFDLPDALVARWPAQRRQDARLLVLDGEETDRAVSDLPALLRPGDLLVMNNTRVLAARIRARRKSGGAVEVLLLGAGEGVVPALVRPARRLKAGEVLDVLPPEGDAPVPGVGIEVVGRGEDGTLRVRPLPGADVVMNCAGQMPIPPYLGRASTDFDKERYQTVFASVEGAVAAPTAGLHLTRPLLDRLREGGVETAEVTLHVGAGTFRNLRAEDLDRGLLHAEWCEVPEQTADAIARCRERGGKVVAVGTTTTRTLESRSRPGGLVSPGASVTRLFLQPGDRFGVVDRLLTNFHLPRSSLLMLVCAFAGTERVMAAYRHAVRGGYRFYSYGDAMLLTASPARTD